MPGIAEFFARETQGWAINKCDYVPVIAALFARETQNFASLLGVRHCYFNTKKVRVSAIVLYTYPSTHFPIQLPFFLHPVQTPHPQYVKNHYEM